METSIPQELRFKAFGQWITSYFEHGDLTKRDLNLLSYILASTVRPPTIFNMSAAEIKDTVFDGPDAMVDLPFLINLKSQINASYRKAFFDPATADLFPKLKISLVAGDRSPSWGPAGMWAVQDDEKASELGSGRINFKLVPGVNHFVRYPPITLTPPITPMFFNSAFLDNRAEQSTSRCTGMIRNWQSTFILSAWASDTCIR